MSGVLIESHTVDDGNHYLTLACGKKSAHVFKTTFGIRVICKNASHAVWRGAGREFDSFDEALAGYKSSEMKAMIECARFEIEGEKSEPDSAEETPCLRVIGA